MVTSLSSTMTSLVRLEAGARGGAEGERRSAGHVGRRVYGRRSRRGRPRQEGPAGVREGNDETVNAQVGTDRGLVLVAETLVDVLVHERSLADSVECHREEAE